MLELYQLFLFDFDGLLVDTEELHWRAYRQMCEQMGCCLDWNFAKYCGIAHQGGEYLREQLFATFPELKQQKWELLYREKSAVVDQFYQESAIKLMPGAERLLSFLQEREANLAVVTNSSRKQVQSVLRQHSVLSTISHWVVREDYEQPKPHPESYLKAIRLFGKPGERILGFEDTPRGLRALMATPAEPIWVSPHTYPNENELMCRGIRRFHSLEEIPLVVVNTD